jgi:hypothetical protein
MAQEEKISPETRVGEILEIRGAERILEKYSFPCLSCPLSVFELKKLKVGEVCRFYNIPEEKLLKELNQLLKK